LIVSATCLLASLITAESSFFFALRITILRTWLKMNGTKVLTVLTGLAQKVSIWVKGFCSRGARYL
jgi:hypothetical protein